MEELNACLSRTYQAWGAGRIVVSNGDKKEVGCGILHMALLTLLYS